MAVPVTDTLSRAKLGLVPGLAPEIVLQIQRICTMGWLSHSAGSMAFNPVAILTPAVPAVLMVLPVSQADGE